MVPVALLGLAVMVVLLALASRSLGKLPRIVKLGSEHSVSPPVLDALRRVAMVQYQTAFWMMMTALAMLLAVLGIVIIDYSLRREVDAMTAIGAATALGDSALIARLHKIWNETRDDVKRVL